MGYKTGERRPIEETNAFIIKEIGFDEKQANAFILLAQEHHQQQIANQNEFRRVKDQMNSLMLKGEDQQMDSLISQFGDLATKREIHLYSFFKKVLLICNEEQKRRLQHVFFQATGPPDYAKIPLNRQD